MRGAFVSAMIVGLLAICGSVLAKTVQTIGAGSAVSSIDRFAVFDPLAANGTPLSDYTENGLFIGVDGDSWIGDGNPVFDPFHIPGIPYGPFYFPFGGSPGWVTIQTTDGMPIYALEFLYGNGWTTGDPYGQYPWGNNLAVVQWQLWSGGAMVASGVIGAGPLLEMGTVVGIYDTAGFDQLLVKCTIDNSIPPDYQALAIDNLNVQTTPIGACCLTDGTCAIYSSAACAAAGGVYRGDGITCDQDPCAVLSVDGASGDRSGLELAVVPNPAAGPMMLRYRLSRPSRVALEVFSAAGVLVRRFSEESRPAGTHSVAWDGRDNGGHALPAGVYLTRIATATERMSGRVVLIR